MSIQWTFIAGFLYIEIAVVIIMILPIFSPRRWQEFFKSRLFLMFQQYAAMYFYIVLGVLFLFLMDALREMRKYSHGSEVTHVHLSTEMKGSVKLFRAQRNFYITGFSIFLAFVIKRLVTMLKIQDVISIKAEKMIKEAEATIQLAEQNKLVASIQQQQLEETEQKLKDEQSKTEGLENEVEKWKLKYEEVRASIADGKGDK